MSNEIDLLPEIQTLYDSMGMEEVFGVPSSKIQVKYHQRVKRESRGVIPKLMKDILRIDVYATNRNEGVKVTAALFANKQLENADSFGARHGELMYILPILHLLGFLAVIVFGALFLGALFGLVVAIVAAVTIPILIMWISSSLETRRVVLAENLEATNLFAGPEEIEDTVVWLGTKMHSKRYWIKRILFYEMYYIPITILMIFLYSWGF
jgi:hypothetical protein